MPFTRPPSWVRLLIGTLYFTACYEAAFAAKLRHHPNAAETMNDVATSQHQQRRTCWIFTHLQKSGGTTIKEIVGNWREGQKVLYDSRHWVRGDSIRESFARNMVSGRRNNVVVGGYTEALRLTTEIQEKCAWFTVFRHPVARLVSAFFYCQKLKTDPICATATMPAEAHNDVIAFAKHWGNFGLRQFALSVVPADNVLHYTKATTPRSSKTPGAKSGLKPRQAPGWYLLKMYLDGRTGVAVKAPEPNDVMSDMLKPVQNLLRERYAAVGILEEFNTTLSLFNAALHMPGLDWQMQFADIGVMNVDSKYKLQEEKALSVALTSSELEEYIQLDLLLYEHALAVFHEQARLHGVV